MDTIRPRKFEFALLMAMVAILAVVLMNALERVRVDVEAAGVQTEVAAIRIELLERLTHREAVGGRLPESSNPMRWIANPPQSYLGERSDVPTETTIWYFDTRHQELVYRFRSGHEARFRLVRGNEASNAPASFAGVALNRVEVAGESVK